MKDGMYQVTRGHICAGFVIRDGQVVHCAPVLRRKIHYWKKFAVWLGR